MEDEILKKKEILRRTLLEERSHFPETETRIADAAIASNILGAGFYKDARSVFVYISIGSEVDTVTIAHRAFSDGKTILIPRTKENRILEAVQVEEEDYLQRAEKEWPRCFNIPEPPDIFPALDVSGIDLAIVPSIVLDRWGYRLGYGGGYYDHFISAARSQKKYPVFAAIQRAALVRDEALPREPYDMAVDLIVTENGIVIPSSSA